MGQLGGQPRLPSHVSRLACWFLLQVPMALVSLIDDDRLFFKSVAGTDCRSGAPRRLAGRRRVRRGEPAWRGVQRRPRSCAEAQAAHSCATPFLATIA